MATPSLTRLLSSSLNKPGHRQGRVRQGRLHNLCSNPAASLNRSQRNGRPKGALCLLKDQRLRPTIRRLHHLTILHPHLHSTVVGEEDVKKKRYLKLRGGFPPLSFLRPLLRCSVWFYLMPPNHHSTRT